jgi:hypothetical protein
VRCFDLIRSEDETGISGVGSVAEGVVFDDGVAVLRWHPGPVDAVSTAVYASIADVKTIHGHNGLTKVVFVDE